MTETRDKLFEDIVELHSEYPDFQGEGILFKPMLVIPVACIVGLLSVPLSFLAFIAFYLTENRYIGYVAVTPMVMVGVIFTSLLGSVLADFNEAIADIEEEFGGEGPEFYHCKGCDEFPTAIGTDNASSSKAGIVGVCEHCNDLLYGWNHHNRLFGDDVRDSEKRCNRP